MPYSDPTAASEAQRRNHLRRKYGLTEEDYIAALKRQGNLCAKCGTNDPGRGKKYFTILRRGHQQAGNIQLVCSSCAASLRETQKSPYVQTEDGMRKHCSQCGQLLPLECFYRRGNNKSSAACKHCTSEAGLEPARRQKRAERSRRRMLKRKYGLTAEQYNALLQAQHGRCAVCGNSESGRKGDRHFCVDHDHNTGTVRGLLCHSCNQAIGHLQDRPDLCRQAAVYLEKSCSSHQ